MDQAVQVFTPFYQDQALMKDMAYTKNWNREYARGTGLKKSSDQKIQKQYWDAGVQELQYRREEYKNASADAAMSYSSPTYTNYVNTAELAHDLAKKQGWNVKTSKSDGRYIYTTKNGQQIMEPLQKLFENTLGNDSRVQGVYRTQSYVNRKNYAKSNSAMFEGDENAAEMKYLEDNFNILKRQSQKYYTRLQADADQKDQEITRIEEKYQNKELTAQQAMYLDDLKYNRDINRETLDKIKKEYGEFNSSGSSTATTSTGFENPYGDIETLRRKVDGGMSQMLMRKDLSEAAETEAMRNYEQTMKTDPYGLENVKQANRRSIAKLRGSIQRDNINYKNFLEKENKVNAELEKQGILRKKIVTREYKDATNAQGQTVRYFKDQVSPEVLTVQLGKYNTETIEQAQINPVTGNYIYEDVPAGTDIKNEANTTGGGEVKLDRQEAVNKATENQWTSLAGQEKQVMKGFPQALELLQNVAGTEGELSEKRFLQIATVNSAGEVVDAQTMYDNYDKGDNAREMRRSYEGMKRHLQERKRKGTATALELQILQSPLFTVKNANKVNTSSWAQRKRVKYLQEANEKANTFSDKTNGLLTPQLSKHVMNNDEVAYNKELAKYTIVDNRGRVQKVQEFLGMGGDLVNLVGKKIFDTDGNIIDSQSVAGQLLGVGSNPFEFDNARSAWLKYTDGQDVKVPDWLAENRGSRSSGNTLRGEWAGRTVAHPNGRAGKDWDMATNLILSNPNADFAINGTTLNAFQKGDNKKLKGVLDALIAFRGEGKDFKNKQFQMSYTPTAKNSLDYEALMINQLPSSFLESLVGTDKKPGLLTAEEKNELAMNGLFVSMPKGSLSSLGIAQTSNMDPMDLMIRESGPEGYTYNDPMGEGSINVKYNKNSNTYTAEIQTEFLGNPDAEGNLPGYQRASNKETLTSANWDSFFDRMEDNFMQMANINKNQWNKFYQEVYAAGPEDPQYMEIRQQINNREYNNQGGIKFSELPEGKLEYSDMRIKD